MGAVVLNVCDLCGAYVADEVGHRRWHAADIDRDDTVRAILGPLVRDLERRAAEVAEETT